MIAASDTAFSYSESKALGEVLGLLGIDQKVQAQLVDTGHKLTKVFREIEGIRKKIGVRKMR